MTDTSFELQKKIFTELDSALSISVFDHVPEDTAYPYVVIGDENASEFDSLSGEERAERFITLSIYSNAPGQKEVKQTLQSIHDALHRKTLTIAAGRLVEISIQRTRTTLDADGRSYMGQATIRAVTEQ